MSTSCPSPGPHALVDIVGTGGDGASTFNISTAAALVAAAAGAGVAKHGNRAARSAAGSADVLEALGFALEQPPERIALSIDELGFGFMFAPPITRRCATSAPVRRELGVRTVFNVLGPLANPAGARDEVFGVYSADLAATYRRGPRAARRAARIRRARRRRHRRALAVRHRTSSCESLDGDVREWELDPRELGIYPLRPDGAARRLRGRERATIRAVLAGEKSGRRDAVLLNAAGALVAAGLADDLAEGLELAS